jgi:hypothetical protein
VVPVVPVVPVADSVRHVPAVAPAAPDPAVAGRVVPVVAVPTAVAVTTAAAEAE